LSSKHIKANILAPKTPASTPLSTSQVLQSVGKDDDFVFAKPQQPATSTRTRKVYEKVSPMTKRRFFPLNERFDGSTIKNGKAKAVGWLIRYSRYNPK
jgi:hypothetical protein